MGFPSKSVFTADLITNFFSKRFRRVKVQSLTFTQDVIVSGAGGSAEWIKTSIPAGGKVYAEFVVPEGYYVAVDHRDVTTDKDRLFYRVYKNYSEVTQTGVNVITHNLRSDAPSLPSIVFECNAPSPAPLPATAYVTSPVFGVEGSGNRLSGDIRSEDVFRLLAPGTRYLIELHNESSQACFAQVNFIIGILPVSEIRPL